MVIGQAEVLRQHGVAVQAVQHGADVVAVPDGDGEKQSFSLAVIDHILTAEGMGKAQKIPAGDIFPRQGFSFHREDADRGAVLRILKLREDSRFLRRAEGGGEEPRSQCEGLEFLPEAFFRHDGKIRRLPRNRLFQRVVQQQLRPVPGP